MYNFDDASKERPCSVVKLSYSTSDHSLLTAHGAVSNEVTCDLHYKQGVLKAQYRLQPVYTVATVEGYTLCSSSAHMMQQKS